MQASYTKSRSALASSPPCDWHDNELDNNACRHCIHGLCIRLEKKFCSCETCQLALLICTCCQTNMLRVLFMPCLWPQCAWKSFGSYHPLESFSLAQLSFHLKSVIYNINTCRIWIVQIKGMQQQTVLLMHANYWAVVGYNSQLAQLSTMCIYINSCL